MNLVKILSLHSPATCKFSGFVYKFLTVIPLIFDWPDNDDVILKDWEYIKLTFDFPLSFSLSPLPNSQIAAFSTVFPLVFPPVLNSLLPSSLHPSILWQAFYPCLSSPPLHLNISFGNSSIDLKTWK